MTTKEVLIKAREVLLARGWCQGDFAVDGGAGCRVCIMGALNVACSGDPFCRIRTPACVEKAVCDAAGVTDEYASPSDWNDTPGRTLAEVVALLDAAIAAQP